MLFKKGDYLELSKGRMTILDELGEGGQGEVYLVDYNNQQYAFKYYKEKVDEDFKQNLKNNIAKGSPYYTYLWPKEFVQIDNENCGYIMDLRPSEFVSFISYLSAKNKFKDKSTMIKWCIELVTSFKILHERGYSYQDLNDGSLFLNPNTGDVLICDNDNIVANNTNLGILGKVRYMAPEICRGDKDKTTGKRMCPDVHSDRFSLAIILFLTLCKGNPFEGELLKNYPIVDEKCEYEMFAKNPIYIFSKDDTSNRPIRGYHTAVLNLYPMLPSYLKEAFHKTFTLGLKDRENGRITELEWLRLLCEYRDELIMCPHCGHTYAYGYKDKKHNDECPYCHKKTMNYCYLQIGKHKIALFPGKCVYKFHLNKYSSTYNSIVGKVIQNPKNPALWGIKLRLEDKALIKDSLGHQKVIEPDGVIPIINHLMIQFPDNNVAEIVSNY